MIRDGPWEWAADLPPERAQGASNSAFSVWTGHQPEEALQWVVDLPASDERRPEFLRRFVMNTVYHVDAEVAAERLAILNSTDRAVVREQIELAGSVSDEKKQQLLRALGQ